MTNDVFLAFLCHLVTRLPLLAVAYCGGWRKHEKSESQSRILQAALYEEFHDHDKKGFVLEENCAGATHPVQDKQGTVLEKKRPGTVHHAQGTASSEIPFVDRELAIECDPLLKPPDAGIFACGMDSHCVESEESELGGFCVAFEQAPILNRALQPEVECVDVNEDGAICDCSLFNNTSGVGSFTCSNPDYCVGQYFGVFPRVCGNLEITYAFPGNQSGTTTYCFEPDGGMPAESLCYSSSYSSMLYNGTSWECEFKVNDIKCNSCLVEDYCPANSN
jgi:hypothetical protein